MQINITTHPLEWLKLKRPLMSSVTEDVEQLELQNSPLLLKLNIHLAYGTAILLEGFSQEKLRYMSIQRPVH